MAAEKPEFRVQEPSKHSGNKIKKASVQEAKGKSKRTDDYTMAAKKIKQSAPPGAEDSGSSEVSKAAGKNLLVIEEPVQDWSDEEVEGLIYHRHQLARSFSEEKPNIRGLWVEIAERMEGERFPKRDPEEYKTKYNEILRGLEAAKAPSMDSEKNKQHASSSTSHFNSSFNKIFDGSFPKKKRTFTKHSAAYALLALNKAEGKGKVSGSSNTAVILRRIFEELNAISTKLHVVYKKMS